MRAFCTYFDSRFAVRALAMYHSLARSAPDLRMYMLCLDDAAHRLIAGLGLPGVTPIPLGELEAADPELVATKSLRNPVEYIYTCTSCWSWYLLRRYPEVSLLTYVDADLYFCSAVEPLFRELDSASIGVSWHRHPPREPPRFGRFNVGWVSWRRDDAGLSCLRRYREQCLEWCFEREEEGKFADQKYLDEWSELPGFHAFRSKGANVARWNLEDYRYTVADGRVQVDGEDLIFFHFAGIRQLLGRLHSSGVPLRTVRDRSVLRKHVVLPYFRDLRRLASGRPFAGTQRPFARGLGPSAKDLLVAVYSGALVCA
jgi:hypothetical protein